MREDKREHFERRIGCPRHHGGCMRRRGPEGFAPDLNDLEGLFMACARTIRHKRHRHFGFSQDRILHLLAENGGTLAQKSLQQLLDVAPGSISEILSKMEEKGLISREKSEDDRKSNLITLLKDVEETEKKDSFFDVLSEEEKESLKALLKKALDASLKEEE